MDAELEETGEMDGTMLVHINTTMIHMLAYLALLVDTMVLQYMEAAILMLLFLLLHKDKMADKTICEEVVDLQPIMAVAVIWVAILGGGNMRR